MNWRKNNNRINASAIEALVISSHQHLQKDPSPYRILFILSVEVHRRGSSLHAQYYSTPHPEAHSFKCSRSAISFRRGRRYRIGLDRGHLNTSRNNIRSNRHSTRIPPHRRNNSTVLPDSLGDSHRRPAFFLAGVVAGIASGVDLEAGHSTGLEQDRMPVEAVAGSHHHNPGEDPVGSNRD